MSSNLVLTNQLDDKIGYYNPEEEHRVMGNKLREVFDIVKLLEFTTEEREFFLSKVLSSADYSDKVEEKIKELKERVDEVEMAFCGIALWAHEKRKRDAKTESTEDSH